jgi:deoxycytidylate deaminase
LADSRAIDAALISMKKSHSKTFGKNILITAPFFRAAAKVAGNSGYLFQLGAVVVKGHNVLSSGYNSVNTHTKVNNFPSSRHAEMDAILKVMKQHDGLQKLAGAKLYVTRITKTGRTAMAKPCKKCLALAKAVGIKKIYYTTENSTETLKL